MEENNNAKAIAVIVSVLLCVLILGKIFFRSREKAVKAKARTESSGSNYQKVTVKPVNPGYTPAPSGGGPSLPVYEEQPEFLEEMEKKLEERLIEVEKEKAVWLEKMINDPSLATKTREVYRLRSIKEIKDAHDAMEQKDYSAAMENFVKAMQDPKASPLTKYLCYDYMIEICRKTNDYETLFKLWKEQALINKETNLDALGMKKDDYQLRFVKQQERLFRIANTPGELQRILETEGEGNAEKTARLEKTYKRDIEYMWGRLHGKI
jgi:hypothetical protein